MSLASMRKVQSYLRVEDVAWQAREKRKKAAIALSKTLKEEAAKEAGAGGEGTDPKDTNWSKEAANKRPGSSSSSSRPPPLPAGNPPSTEAASDKKPAFVATPSELRSKYLESGSATGEGDADALTRRLTKTIHNKVSACILPPAS